MPHRLNFAPAEPVLIAGLGSIGRRHFANLRALGLSRFILYRTYQSTMGEIDLAGLDAALTSDLQEALSHKPRLAIVCNPTARHLDVARPAAEAGCDLFIEKPLSHSLTGCQELAQIVADKKLVTMIGCQYRFHPLLVSLRAQLHAGRLGKVHKAHAEWGEYLPDWHPWEDHRQSYSARSDLGGGVILTLVHPLDYLFWIFGPLADVHATIGREAILQTAVADDWADIDLQFTSGVVAQVHLDYLQKPPVHQLTIWGERGRATWNYHDGSLVWDAADGTSDCERLPPDFERNALFVEEMREFLGAANERRQSAIPLADGIAVLEVALKAKASAASEVRCG